MRTEDELGARIAGYTGCKYYYHPDVGYIAWQVSTGDNVEIMFIEVKEKGKGNATFLLKEMLKWIEPYHSIFVFRRLDNMSAARFYQKMGFCETVIPKIYKEGDAVLGVVSYQALKYNLGV